METSRRGINLITGFEHLDLSELYYLEDAVNELRSYLPFSLTQNMFDALVSFVRDVGVGILNSFRGKGARFIADEMLRYCYVDGYKDAAFERRRRAERDLFLSDVVVCDNCYEQESDKAYRRCPAKEAQENCWYEKGSFPPPPMKSNPKQAVDCEDDDSKTVEYGKYVIDKAFEFGKYVVDKNAECKMYTDDKTAECSKYVIDKTVEFGKYVVDKTVEFGKYVVDKNVKCEKYAADKAAELGERVVDKTVEYGKCVVGKAAELGIYSVDKTAGFGEGVAKVVKNLSGYTTGLLSYMFNNFFLAHKTLELGAVKRSTKLMITNNNRNGKK